MEYFELCPCFERFNKLQLALCKLVINGRADDFKAVYLLEKKLLSALHPLPENFLFQLCPQIDARLLYLSALAEGVGQVVLKAVLCLSFFKVHFAVCYIYFVKNIYN